jgi:NAD(P) transhydrogenase subunit alpha
LVSKDGAFAPNHDDEILKAAILTRSGAVVHPNFAPAGGQAA